MDPSTHWVVGQAEDTVGDVINRFKSGSWTEADLLITVNDTPLSWTERVHERVFPGALVIVSLNIRANATTYKAPMGRDQTPSDSGPILTHLKGPKMELPTVRRRNPSSPLAQRDLGVGTAEHGDKSRLRFITTVNSLYHYASARV